LAAVGRFAVVGVGLVGEGLARFVYRNANLKPKTLAAIPSSREQNLLCLKVVLLRCDETETRSASHTGYNVSKEFEILDVLPGE